MTKTDKKKKLSKKELIKEVCEIYMVDSCGCRELVERMPSRNLRKAIEINKDSSKEQ